MALIYFKKDFFQNHKPFLAREKTVVIAGTPSIFSSCDVFSDVRREGGQRREQGERIIGGGKKGGGSKRNEP